MDHNIRYNTPELYHAVEETTFESHSSLKPPQFLSQTHSHASSKSTNLIQKSRSKHQAFRPTIRSQSEQSEGFPVCSDAVSEYGARRQPPPRERSIGMNSQVNYNELEARYRNVQNLLQQENHNLKEQTRMLLQELRRVTAKQRKYKSLYEETKQQLAVTAQERDAYQQQAMKLKMITEHQMRVFQSKLEKVVVNEQQPQYYGARQMRNQINVVRNHLPLSKSPSISQNTNSDTLL